MSAPLNQSRVFSSSSLEAGTKHLREQQVKIESDEERKNLEAELKDSLAVEVKRDTLLTPISKFQSKTI